jgi:hypothetical protein
VGGHEGPRLDEGVGRQLEIGVEDQVEIAGAVEAEVVATAETHVTVACDVVHRPAGGQLEASQRFGAAAVVDQEEVRLQIGPPAGHLEGGQVARSRAGSGGTARG